MKRTLLYLMVLALTGFSAKGQVTTPLWYEYTTGLATPSQGTNGYPWFTTATTTINSSAAYNPSTNTLYVSQRGVGPAQGGKIYKINAQTGVLLGELLLGGEYVNAQYDFQKIRVTEDGEIYAVTMRLANANPIIVYYWENENSLPKRLVLPHDGGSNIRLGDSFDVIGKGQNTCLIFGGSGSSDIVLYNRVNSGINFSYEFSRRIAMGGNFAITSISAIPNISNLVNSSYVVSGNGQTKKYINASGAIPVITNIYGTIDDYFAPNFSVVKYFTINGMPYMAVTGGSQLLGYNVKVYKVVGTDYSLSTSFSLVHHFKATKTDVVSNSAVSDLALTNSNLTVASKDANGNAKIGFFQLVQQNALSAWVAEFDVSLARLSNLNVVNENQDGKITWTTTKENDMKEFQILRSSDGVNFSLLTTVTTKATNGNSTTANEYEYTDENPLSGDNYYQIKMVNKASIEDFSTIISFNTLPVSLSSFTASVKNGKSTLEWITSSESNNKGFEIQRSTEGKEFKTIAFVNSKAENGNSSSVLTYSYIDKTAVSGTSYYRLNQLDFDGKNQLHEIKAVNLDLSKPEIEVYPNPITSYIRIKAADYVGLEYRLYDTSGKMVAVKKATDNETEISAISLSRSVYILKAYKNGKELLSIKIIK